MFHMANVCRGFALRKNLESPLADWERWTIFHYDSVPILEILLNRSYRLQL